MVIVCLPNGSEWYKPNWVFRQISEDVAVRFPGDGDLRLALEKAEAFGMLALDSIERTVAAKMLSAFAIVLEETVQGKVQGWKRTKPDDLAGQSMYLEAVAELLDLVKEADKQ